MRNWKFPQKYCPLHKTHMFYSFFHETFACLKPQCEWGKGVTSYRLEVADNHKELCHARLGPERKCSKDCFDA